MLSIVLNNFAVIFTLLFGIASLVRPEQVAKSTMALQTLGRRGQAEFRIGIGGAFIGITAYALYTQSQHVFTALGWLWLGAAITRIMAVFIDKPKLSQTYWVVFVIEVVMAVCLFA